MNQTNIHVSVVQYYDGPLDGGRETVTANAARHEITWPVFLAKGLTHPFQAHLYRRIGATNSYLYCGVKSFK